jgi:transposase
VIQLPAGTKIWLAAGKTDMRRGFDGLSAQVQTVLQQQPFSGHVFVFRGRRGDIVKCLWFDGDGLCLFAKRLEKGRFIWPQAMNTGESLSSLIPLLRVSTSVVAVASQCLPATSRAEREKVQPCLLDQTGPARAFLARPQYAISVVEMQQQQRSWQIYSPLLVLFARN